MKNEDEDGDFEITRKKKKLEKLDEKSLSMETQDDGETLESLESEDSGDLSY
jgi:hypothetical protein